MGNQEKSTHKRRNELTLGIALFLFGTFLILVITIGLVSTTKEQKKLAFCANSLSCITNLTGEKEPVNEGIFMGKQVAASDIPEQSLFALSETKAVLGNQTGEYKHIYVSLNKQHLYAYEGTQLVYDFPVSTGKWNPTPTGDFRIWVWLRYTRMTGGNQALGTYYDLPNVPYTMYYYNEKIPKTWGYSVHGAYWHDNFGNPMSHGCINMRIEDAGKLYTWTNPQAGNVTYPTEGNPGPLLTVYGTTPK